MEDYGYKFIHKLAQFVTTLVSRKNCSIDLKPKDFKSSDSLSILCTKPLRRDRKLKFKSGFKVRILKYGLPLRKGYKSQLTQNFLKLLQLLAENYVHTQKKMIRMRLYVANFLEKV